jgi:glycosyl transferase family 25
MNVSSLPIFIINMKTAVHRKKKMERKMRRYALPCTFIEATIPETLEGTYVNYLRPSQRACTHSHIRILQKIVNEGLEAAIILEDDVVFRSDWVPIVNSKLSELEKTDSQWDALFLNVSEPYSEKEAWHVARNQCLAGAYIIRNHAAAWILQTFSNMYYCIDWMTQILQNRGHSYTYYPWLAIQEGNESYNGSNVSADYEKVERCLSNSNFGLEHYDF